MPNIIYFDHIAATRPHEEVATAMIPYLRENFGNPTSLHQIGQTAQQAVEQARKDVAQLIGASPEEIVFTANGSEANNLAIKGAGIAYQNKGKHIITSAIEHYSVLHPTKSLEKLGFRITQISVDKYGIIDPQSVLAAIEPDTILISIMHANSEIGTIQPLQEIGKITRERGILFHSDAVTTVGKIPLDVNQLNVDLLSLAGNQFYGPKGAAALYVRKKTRLIPLIEGGLQEDGRRAGIPDVAALVGLGKAAQLAKIHQEEWSAKARQLERRLRSTLTEKLSDVIFTGHPEQRLPGHLSLCVKYIEGEGMLLYLDMEGIAAASGSACISQALKSSYVLDAIGIDPADSQGSLVISLGKDNTDDEVEYFINVFPPIIERLRQMSPIYKNQRNK